MANNDDEWKMRFRLMHGDEQEVVKVDTTAGELKNGTWREKE